MNSIAVKNSDVARDGYLSLTDPLNDGYEWGKVSRVVADDIVRTRVEGGIPEMRVVGVAQRRGRSTGGWLGGIGDEEQWIQQALQLVRGSADGGGGLSSTSCPHTENAPGLRDDCRRPDWLIRRGLLEC